VHGAKLNVALKESHRRASVPEAQPLGFVLAFHVRHAELQYGGGPVREQIGATHAQLTCSLSNGAPSVSHYRRSRFRKASGNQSSHTVRSGVLRQLAASRHGTFNTMPSLWPFQWN